MIIFVFKGTILVDTVNKSVQAGKITPRDEAVLAELLPLVPDIKGDNLFEELLAAKLDLSGKGKLLKM
ncbi:hypothetical protein DPMN_048147 [Dreissena polymorpha]|uniref:Uncharacterized protein n=1 Tax=Dreissena polymorpha TaxID=45954 RepID=A0A9D4I3N8_DREPO|nr:hypothetical protein DPMN_048096 [Dreissena polymorpha]KAH3741422.1 hypothetical protein DPMN_048147 [Dreissena polymorpha]